MTAEVSGRSWCVRFPGSVSHDDLSDVFRPKAEAFAKALAEARDGNGKAPTVTISATLRPKQRAYLMHWCCKIADGTVMPEDVPPMAGVDIDWTHGGLRNAAVAAARQMKATYLIAFPPSLTSKHITGDAIDMSIAWDGMLTIRNANGTLIAIGSAPHDGTNPELAKVGAGFGVIKLKTDAPHWSVDGH